MTGTVTGVWGARRTDLDPERPHLYYWCPDDPIDVLGDDVAELPGHGEAAARRTWADVYAPAVPLVHQAVGYGDWREATAADTQAARTSPGALDWAVGLPGGKVDRQGSYDAARRRAYDGWPLLVRDITRSEWEAA